MFRYYLSQRPPMPGAFPRFAATVEDFGERKEVPGVRRPVWGYVEYEAPLSHSQMEQYELREAGPFYINKATGEILSRQAMLRQFSDEYDGGDPANALGCEEYYEEVEDNA